MTAVASAPRLTGDAQRTRLVVDVASAVTPITAVRADPPQVVIDLPGVRFAPGSEAQPQPALGLVTAVRFGLFTAQQARIVLDAAGPVRLVRSDRDTLAGGTGVRLTFEIAPSAEPKAPPVQAQVPQQSPAPQAATVPPPAPQEKQALKPALTEDGTAKPPVRRSGRPVVVLDPGHGGIDPGAAGAGDLREKAVVLAVGRQVRALLLASRRYDVVMTRSSDVFVSLDERLAISERHQADLFVSIHADAVAEADLAQSVRGASVYTLSEQASDAAARRFAERENAADLRAGLAPAAGDQQDSVRAILVDLWRRETANFSNNFSGLLVNNLRRSVTLSREPQRAAAFKVLRQTHAPSVLIELGYMSHLEDQKLLSSPGWQKTVAETIAAAIDAYFERRVSADRRK